MRETYRIELFSKNRATERMVGEHEEHVMKQMHSSSAGNPHADDSPVRLPMGKMKRSVTDRMMDEHEEHALETRQSEEIHSAYDNSPNNGILTEVEPPALAPAPAPTIYEKAIESYIDTACCGLFAKFHKHDDVKDEIISTTTTEVRGADTSFLWHLLSHGDRS